VQGRAATIEPTTRLSATPRLDQIAAVHLLAEQAEGGAIAPVEGSSRLEEIRRMGTRSGHEARTEHPSRRHVTRTFLESRFAFV
jgi:hypothetical protein